eukprot:s1023_g31.t1
MWYQLPLRESDPDALTEPGTIPVLTRSAKNAPDPRLRTRWSHDSVNHVQKRGWQRRRRQRSRCRLVLCTVVRVVLNAGCPG